MHLASDDDPNDLHAPARTLDDGRVAYRPTFVSSLVMTPIVVGEPVGAIGAYWSWTHEATADERRLLTRLADVTASAMRAVGFGA